MKKLVKGILLIALLTTSISSFAEELTHENFLCFGNYKTNRQYRADELGTTDVLRYTGGEPAGYSLGIGPYYFNVAIDLFLSVIPMNIHDYENKINGADAWTTTFLPSNLPGKMMSIMTLTNQYGVAKIECMRTKYAIKLKRITKKELDEIRAE